MPAAWLIDGVDVPAAVGRNVAYVALGGASGVSEPGGFRVAPLEVPGAGVRVLPGAASVLNRYPGGGQQSYALYDQVQQEVPVAGTSSSGARSDLVIARVYDPEFQTVPAGKAPGAAFELLQGVPAAAISSPEAARAYCAALAYPAEPLAGITQPASSATVTAAMVTDLRVLARPRQSQLLIGSIPAGSPAVTTTAGTQWSGYAPFVEVPSWATHVQVLCTLASLQVTGTTSGAIESRLGSLVSSTLPYDYENATGVTTRDSLQILGGWEIPTAMRGTAQQLRLHARRDAGKTGTIAMVGTHVGFDLRFYERTV